MKEKVFCLSVFLIISGCSMFNDEYSCGDIPKDSCTSVAKAYEGTNGDLYDYRDLGKKQKSDESITIEIAETNQVLDYISPGDPILTKPVIMRVLYKSFQTDQKDFDAGGYVYLRMKESEWVLKK